jgi:hypothetical protein
MAKDPRKELGSVILKTGPQFASNGCRLKVLSLLLRNKQLSEGLYV